eukprot:NODE_536_length_6333_cov_0.998877.p1 type:complete len:439 gc:universal NODE_536_length_6333_cov_0.998877:4877-3561(-)
MFHNCHKNLFRKTHLPKGTYLLRDYIYNALYNPHYGYFNKFARILSPKINLAEIKSQDDFNLKLNKIYQEASKIQFEINKNDVFGQLPFINTCYWHTPSELFSPIYGQIMANYIIEQSQNCGTNENFTVLEVGPGNGTLMNDILDFLKEQEPKIYKRIKYKIVDISNFDIKTQHKNVEIVQDSILNLRRTSNEYHIILLNEVLDNFAFDSVRYLNDEPFQGSILYNPEADSPHLVYTEVYSRLEDPHILKLHKILETRPSKFERFKSNLPFMNNLTRPYFIPTQISYLFQVLKAMIPNHSMLISDFDSLHDAIPGNNGPRIHAAIDGQTVTVPSLCVAPGPFDIFFPIDMKMLEKIYKFADNFYSVSQRIEQPYFSYSADVSASNNFDKVNRDKVYQHYSHRQFCLKYLNKTTANYQLKDKSAPLLEFYQNFQVFLIN